MNDLPRPTLIVFDMDGVLVDVSGSYRPTIAATIRDYFALVLNLPVPPADLITPADLEHLKLAGGLNNDWDMAAAGISYVLSLLPASTDVPDLSPAVSNKTDPDRLLAALRRAAAGLTVDWASVLAKKDVAALARAAAKGGGSVAGVQAAAGPRNRGLLSYQGTLRDADLVTRLFQERYLGAELFRATCGEAPRFLPNEAGLCRQERLMISPDRLRRLAARFPLGIATGRPRAEAHFALDLFDLRDCFQAMVTDDDVLEEEDRRARATGVRPSYRKPDPFMLLTALDALGGPDDAGLYVGDTHDDIRTAQAAAAVRPVWAVGCCAANSDRTEARRAFLALGADLVVDDLEEFVQWLLDEHTGE